MNHVKYKINSNHKEISYVIVKRFPYSSGDIQMLSSAWVRLHPEILKSANTEWEFLNKSFLLSLDNCFSGAKFWANSILYQHFKETKTKSESRSHGEQNKIQHFVYEIPLKFQPDPVVV